MDRQEETPAAPPPPRRDPAGTLTGVLFPTRRTTPVLDGDDRVIGEAWCIRCGGLLTRRLLTERCLECDHPVSDSIHGDFLQYADRALVLGLVDAARFVKYATMFLGALVAMGVVGSLAQSFQGLDFGRGLDIAFRILLAGAFITPIIAAAGMFTLTSRKSAAYFKARYYRRDVIMRCSLLVVGIVLVSCLGLYFIPKVFKPLIFTAWAVVPVAMFLHGVEQLLRRVPSPQDAAGAKVLLGLVIASGIALLLVLLLQQYLADDSEYRDLLTGVTLLTIMGAIGLTVAGIQILRRTEYALRRAGR